MIVKPFSSISKIIAFLSLGLLFASSTLAQNSTSSPYSYYGLGELNLNGTGNSISMGGTGLAYRNGGVLNILNPASLAHVDSLKFIFNVGMAAKYTNLNQGDKSDFLNDYNLTRIAFGFKVSPRYSTAFSITPYSSLGYDISKVEKVIGSDDLMNRSLKGSGGLNQLVWSNGVKLTDKLSVGLNGIYLFGNNSRDEVITLNSSSYVYRNNSDLISQGIYFNLGAQYQMELGKYNLTLGAMYQPKLGVRAKQKVEVTNFSSGAGAVRHEDTDRGAFDVPETYGLGFGIQKGKHLWIGGDYMHEKWSETEVFKKDNALRDRNKFSLGMEYKADDGYARKFLKKMTYRLGGFYDTGYITVEDEKINAMGVSLGFGIPMARNTGMINIALEFGISGTTSNNMVREDFTRITVDINLFEKWFVKRKYH
jgi:hypothetical protein